MPKKVRQAHVPKQQVARRRPVRRPVNEAAVSPSPVVAEEPARVDLPQAASAPSAVEARPRRRLELIQQTREAPTLRTIPGQLPTYEHAYLMRELRTIGTISTALLGLIIVLTIVLR